MNQITEQTIIPWQTAISLCLQYVRENDEKAIVFFRGLKKDLNQKGFLTPKQMKVIEDRLDWIGRMDGYKMPKNTFIEEWVVKIDDMNKEINEFLATQKEMK